MKKMLGVVGAIFMILVMIGGFKLTANAQTSGNFDYDILTDGTIEITEYKGSSKNVVVPDTIKGKKVTSIGVLGFYNHKNLETISLPNGITHIGSGVFYGTAFYKNAKNWENGVLYLSDYLIEAKEKELKGSYTVKEGTKCIGETAFIDCTGLTKITIPDSVSYIGSMAFSGCEKLDKIEISQNLKSIGNNILYDTAYFNKRTNWKNNVLYLDKYLLNVDFERFRGSYKIKEDTKCIAENAFEACEGLTDITIPDSITNIPDCTFYGCSNLTKINFPKNLTGIGMGAFMVCENLKNIVIPDTVINIGTLVFYKCTKLEKVVLSKNTDTIYGGMFAECKSLTSVTIPKNVKTIRDMVFSGCSKLIRINYDGTKVDWKKIKVGDENKELTQATIYCKDGTIAPSALKPTTIKTITRASNSIKVSWKKASGVTGYQVQIATDSKFNRNKKVYSVTGTSKTITKLKSSQKYYIRVRTYKGSSKSKWSKVVTVTTKLKATTFKTFSKTKTSVSMTWNKVSGITGYQIQLATDKKFKKSVQTVKIIKATKTKTTVKKLKSVKKYYVRIRTYKGKEYSDWSKINSITTK